MALKRDEAKAGRRGVLGVGDKDEDGRQVRIEHRGEFIRASRTGGVAARVEKRVGGVNLTANTARGLRASKRIGRGVRVALQNGGTRLIGRWKSGPFAFNLSKSGVSGSLKNRAGTYNLLKPRYSSFKFAGIQVRGQKAATAQLIYMGFAALLGLAYFAFRLALWLVWVLSLLALLAVDFIVELAKQLRQNRDAP